MMETNRIAEDVVVGTSIEEVRAKRWAQIKDELAQAIGGLDDTDESEPATITENTDTPDDQP